MYDEVPFPIPYQGSKRKLAGHILACFPEDADRLIEPFCGSAAVSIAALAKGAVQGVHLNDTNSPLMCLWQRIIDEPNDLADHYRALWHSQDGRERAFYDFVRDEFNRTHREDYLLYLLARCVKAAVRYNASGEFNQSPDNRRKGCKPDRMARHIASASMLLRGRAETSSVDYKELLEIATKSDIVYMDPPYQGVSTNRDRRYRDIVEMESFATALDGLNDRHISYIISYDGRTGSKRHGKPLPETLHLAHIEIDAGRSTQSTFLGQSSITYESLYLSPALLDRIGGLPKRFAPTQQSFLIELESAG